MIKHYNSVGNFIKLEPSNIMLENVLKIMIIECI